LEGVCGKAGERGGTWPSTGKDLVPNQGSKL
jgi:hypothetical protein